MLIAATALKLAMERHGDQADGLGKPYIGHLLRVAARVADDPYAVTTALLHDILEDTQTTAAELCQVHLIPPYIVEAVQLLTEVPDLTYMQNIERLAPNPLARRVKIADLEDNLDPRRWLEGERAAARRKRYAEALQYLRACNG